MTSRDSRHISIDYTQYKESTPGGDMMCTPLTVEPTVSHITYWPWAHQGMVMCSLDKAFGCRLCPPSVAAVCQQCPASAPTASRATMSALEPEHFLDMKLKATKLTSSTSHASSLAAQQTQFHPSLTNHIAHHHPFYLNNATLNSCYRLETFHSTGSISATAPQQLHCYLSPSATSQQTHPCLVAKDG